FRVSAIRRSQSAGSSVGTVIAAVSNHGGCHPVGLALAAQQRGFKAEVWINQTSALFVDGVRDEANKQIVELVDTCFKQQAEQESLPVNYANITQDNLFSALQSGALALMSVILLLCAVTGSSAFADPIERGLTLCILAAAHFSQFIFNVPVLNAGERQGESYWNVRSGPMLFIFVMDGAQAIINLGAAIMQF
ncbi:MAG: peptidase C39 family protein, partial [Chakrabartia sp.]